MINYNNDVKQLLEYIGGKENIGAVSHCATRMRFVLNNTSLADEDKIKAIKSVKGTFTQAGQFQVIIGNDVANFYNEFTKVAGVEGVSKESVKDAAKSNMNFIQKVMANIAEIFAPLIPAIIVGGLILGFRNIIGEIKMFEDGTKTLIEISQFWAGVHIFLWLIGEAIFHFLPVGITWAVTKKMGTTQILGIVLGITLVSPQLLNAYSVAGAESIPYWDFGFAKVNMIGYQAQVIPAILAGFVLVYLERAVRKIVPDSISMILVPFLALVPTVLIAHVVLGPIGWAIGAWVSKIVYGGLTSSFGSIFAAVFGFLYAPLVITGLHHTLLPVDLQLISDIGGTFLWPIIALSNIAQASAVLAMIYVNRKNEDEKQISIPACISGYLGVTEPAMFGVNLKYLYPFIASMIGAGVAGMFSMAMGCMANSVGVGGLPAILSMQSSSMLMYLVAMGIAIVVPFILTIVFSKTKLANMASK